MNARRVILVSLCALVGVLAFSSATAVAFETHVAAQPIGSGEKGSGAGQMDLDYDYIKVGNGETVQIPSGIAVNQSTGDIYIADTGNQRIDELEPDGAFMRAWGWGVADGQSRLETCGPDAFPPTLTCQAGISGSGAGQFVHPVFIAVDNSTGPSKGDVYVGDYGDGLVTKFNAEGALESAWGDTTPTPDGQLGPYTRVGITLSGIAVDANGDLSVAYYNFSYTLPTVADFTPEGGLIEELSRQKKEGASYQEEEELSWGTFVPHGVAVDSEGNLFQVGEKGATGGTSSGIEEITRSGRLIGQLKASEPVPTGLAVDSGTGDLYADTGSSVEQFVYAGLGVVEEQGSTCTVEPKSLFGSRCSATTSFGAGDIGAGAGIAVVASTHDVYVADAATSRIDVFVPAIIPDVATGAASEVKGRSATVAGTVDPDGEGPAKCQVVWGTTTEFGHVTPCEQVEVPDGNAPVAVQAKLTELQPDTTYYYRVQATNRNGTSVGTSSEDRQFSTPGPGLKPGIGSSVFDVAATSATLEASIDPNNGPLSPVPGAPTSYYFQYSTASTAGCEVAPASCTSVPAAPGEAIGPGESYLEVSQHVQGLSAGTVYHYRVVALSESAGEIITVDGPDQTFTTQPGGGTFQLPDGRQWELVSPPDKHGAYIFPFTELGFAAQASVDGDAMAFLTSTPTESGPPGYVEVEQVLSARGPDGWVSRDISSPHERATGVAVGQGGEYVAFSENLSLAVVQPHGFFDPSLSPEASAQTAYLRTNFLHGNVDDPCVESCYRPLVTGKPGYANVPAGTVFGEECAKQGANICGPKFTGATPDLSHIALSSAEPLLGGQNETEGYEWFEGKLSRGNHLRGPRVSTSEDGSWNYVMSESVLAAGAVPGEPNMYVSNGGVTKLIAVLSKVDFPDWEGELRSRTSRVSPDGRWFAFMSQRELTGYNTYDAVSGQPDEEVYLYHAPEDLATEAGTLVCASCDPTGARPVGVEYEKLRSQGRNRVMAEISWRKDDPSIAANVPGWTPYGTQVPIYQSRYLSNGGRLFFDSNDALVPQDVNGNEDVYEYEPAGYTNEEGRVECMTASATFSGRSGGCVDLISSGQDSQESAFMDASGSGGDVFFMTAGRLVAQDYDTAYDVYDAHECTSAAPCFPAPAAVPPPCETGDSCKPAPTPQPTIYGAPSSETFSGPGNVSASAPPVAVVRAKSLTRAQKLALALRACHSRRGTRRGICERQARARYGARKSSRAAKRDRG
jgi:NHL repeat-containing protein